MAHHPGRSRPVPAAPAAPGPPARRRPPMHGSPTVVGASGRRHLWCHPRADRATWSARWGAARWAGRPSRRAWRAGPRRRPTRAGPPAWLQPGRGRASVRHARVRPHGCSPGWAAPRSDAARRRPAAPWPRGASPSRPGRRRHRRPQDRPPRRRNRRPSRAGKRTTMTRTATVDPSRCEPPRGPAPGYGPAGRPVPGPRAGAPVSRLTAARGTGAHLPSRAGRPPPRSARRRLRSGSPRLRAGSMRSPPRLAAGGRGSPPPAPAG